MADLVIPVQIDGIDILVQTTTVAGTEPTSTKDATGKIRDAFADANAVIASIAKSTVHTMKSLGQAAQPDKFTVEFGISFSTKGNIIIAGVDAGATLKVTLTYESSS